MTTVTINTRGLYYASIPVYADSRAALTDDAETIHPYDHTAQMRTGLRVDGRFYPLLLSKFLDGRPELRATLDAALTQVRDAIAALGTTDAGRSRLALYYDWTGELSDDGVNGLCLLCPTCGAEEELAGRVQLASSYDEPWGTCAVCNQA